MSAIRSHVRSDTHTEAWLLKRDNTAISITPDGGVHATGNALSGAAIPLVDRVKMQEAMVISVACEINFSANSVPTIVELAKELA